MYELKRILESKLEDWGEELYQEFRLFGHIVFISKHDALSLVKAIEREESQ